MANVKVTPRLVETDVTADGIQQDEVFEVEFLFEDLATDPANNENGVVLSGYTDVLFNPTKILLESDGIAYADAYAINQAGENRLSNNGEQVGRISEVGAATGRSIEDIDSQVVFTLTFEAQTDLTTASATIESEKPDEPTNLTTIVSSDDDQTRNTDYGELNLGPGVNIIESDGSTDVSEDGETDTYELVLNSQPTADVTIEVNNIGQVTLDPASLTFTPDNWNEPQEVTVTADDDDFEEGEHTTPITHSITDDSASEYVEDVSINNVVANITDNDVTNQAPEFEGEPFEFTLDPAQPEQFSETVTASDEDEINFSITDGNDPDGNDTDAFSINNEGVITVADAAELEGQDVFNLTVEASDGDLTSSANVEINVGASVTATLDIGGNGELDQPDALLLLGFAFGDDGLIGSVIEDANANSFTPNVDRNIEEVKSFIQNNETVVDIGGNGEVDQLDALLLLGFAFGDDGLIGSVIEDANANSFTPNVDRNIEEVKDFIEANSP